MPYELVPFQMGDSMVMVQQYVPDATPATSTPAPAPALAPTDTTTPAPAAQQESTPAVAAPPQLYGTTVPTFDGAPLFNEEAYLAANPDVAQAVRDGIFRDGAQHFNNYGKYENRDPSGSRGGSRNHFWESREFDRIDEIPEDFRQALMGDYLGGGYRNQELADALRRGLGTNSSWYDVPVYAGNKEFKVALDKWTIEPTLAAWEKDKSQDLAVMLRNASGDGIGVAVPRWESGVYPGGYDVETGRQYMQPGSYNPMVGDPGLGSPQPGTPTIPGTPTNPANPGTPTNPNNGDDTIPGATSPDPVDQERNPTTPTNTNPTLPPIVQPPVPTNGGGFVPGLDPGGGGMTGGYPPAPGNNSPAQQVAVYGPDGRRYNNVNEAIMQGVTRWSYTPPGLVSGAMMNRSFGSI